MINKTSEILDAISEKLYGIRKVQKRNLLLFCVLGWLAPDIYQAGLVVAHSVKNASQPPLETYQVVRDTKQSQMSIDEKNAYDEKRQAVYSLFLQKRTCFSQSEIGKIIAVNPLPLKNGVVPGVFIEIDVDHDYKTPEYVGFVKNPSPEFLETLSLCKYHTVSLKKLATHINGLWNNERNLSISR